MLLLLLLLLAPPLLRLPPLLLPLLLGVGGTACGGKGVRVGALLLPLHLGVGSPMAPVPRLLLPRQRDGKQAARALIKAVGQVALSCEAIKGPAGRRSGGVGTRMLAISLYACERLKGLSPAQWQGGQQGDQQLEGWIR